MTLICMISCRHLHKVCYLWAVCSQHHNGVGYPSWQPGPALSAQDRAAYQDYCKKCETLWAAQPASMEQWLQDSKKISASPSPYLAERGVSMISKY